MAKGVRKALVVVITLGMLLFASTLTSCAGIGAFVRVEIPDLKTGKEEVYHLDFRYLQIKRVWRERILGKDTGLVLIIVYCQKSQKYITLLLSEGQTWNYLHLPQMAEDPDERLFKADERHKQDWQQFDKPRDER